MPHLKRSVVRRTLLPDSAEGVGEGGCVEGDCSDRVGGGGVNDDDAIDDRLTALLISGNDGSTASLSLTERKKKEKNADEIRERESCLPQGS